LADRAGSGTGHAPITAKVDAYYTGKLAEHGMTPKGVDWSTADSQETRFAQLAELLPADRPYSVCDLGCGYGAFVEHLDARGHDFAYRGVDVSEAMVEAARERWAGRAECTFATTPEALEPSQYAVASGIFNVRMDVDPARWEAYVEDTLDQLHALGPDGFAFNMLTSWSDPERMRDDLYYPDPAAVFSRCKRRYARNVALLHDYGLWEFTILVRTERDRG
jgi:SAM-dependent methyltransferase